LWIGVGFFAAGRQVFPIVHEFVKRQFPVTIRVERTEGFAQFI